jgi:hypothetical protein
VNHAKKKWHERIRFFLYRFFREEISDTKNESFTKGFGEGYRNGCEQTREKLTETRQLLHEFDTLKDSISKGRNVPTMYDPNEVLEFMPGQPIKMGGVPMDEQTLVDLKIEADRIVRSRLWGLMCTRQRNLAVKQAVNRSQNWEQVLAGKAALDIIEQMESMLKVLSEAK